VSSRDFWRATAVSLVLLAVLLGVWHLATLPKQQAVRRERRVREADGQGHEEDPRPADARAGQLRPPGSISPIRSTTAAATTRVSASSSRNFAHPRRLGYALAILFGGAARVPDRHVPAHAPRARSLHPGAEADFAARLDAARALHHQGLVGLRRVRDLHLLGMADADQHGHGVASVRRDWLNVARTLEVKPVRKAFQTKYHARPRPTISRGTITSNAMPSRGGIR